MHFMWQRYVPNRGHNIPTKFVDNRWNDKQIEILLRNSRWRQRPCWILVIWLFRLECMYVFCINFTISLPNLAFDSSNTVTEEMTNVFPKWGWGWPSSWIMVTQIFSTSLMWSKSKSQCFKNFGEDRSDSKEMAAVFWNSRWRRPPSWIMVS